MLTELSLEVRNVGFEGGRKNFYCRQSPRSIHFFFLSLPYPLSFSGTDSVVSEWCRLVAGRQHLQLGANNVIGLGEGCFMVMKSVWMGISWLHIFDGDEEGEMPVGTLYLGCKVVFKPPCAQVLSLMLRGKKKVQEKFSRTWKCTLISVGKACVLSWWVVKTMLVYLQVSIQLFNVSLDLVENLLSDSFSLNYLDEVFASFWLVE